MKRKVVKEILLAGSPEPETVPSPVEPAPVQVTVTKDDPPGQKKGRARGRKKAKVEEEKANEDSKQKEVIQQVPTTDPSTQKESHEDRLEGLIQRLLERVQAPPIPAPPVKRMAPTRRIRPTLVRPPPPPPPPASSPELPDEDDVSEEGFLTQEEQMYSPPRKAYRMKPGYPFAKKTAVAGGNQRNYSTRELRPPARDEHLYSMIFKRSV